MKHSEAAQMLQARLQEERADDESLTAIRRKRMRRGLQHTSGEFEQERFLKIISGR
jgi:hypothetical protein